LSATGLPGEKKKEISKLKKGKGGENLSVWPGREIEDL